MNSLSPEEKQAFDERIAGINLPPYEFEIARRYAELFYILGLTVATRKAARDKKELFKDKI